MNFIDRMKKTISRGYENASGLLNDAAEKAREMGEKGLLQFEIGKLEKEGEHLMSLLGSEVYTLFSEGKLDGLSSAGEVQDLLGQIKKKEAQVDEKQKKLDELKKE